VGVSVEIGSNVSVGNGVALIVAVGTMVSVAVSVGSKVTVAVVVEVALGVRVGVEVGGGAVKLGGIEVEVWVGKLVAVGISTVGNGVAVGRDVLVGNEVGV